jgi:enoyl-CoA hydratase/carnithine racemase
MAEGGRIGLTETSLAIIPGAGGTQRLARLIGVARAKRWIFAATMQPASEALRDGAVDRVVPDDELDDAARELATAIASNGPVAVRLAKRAIDRGIELPIDEAVRLEWDCYEGTIGTWDREEALRAFAEKRPPEFRGE